MDISWELFCAVIDRKNAGPQSPARHFARAFAIETDMDISQEPIYAVIYRKMPGPTVNTSIEHRAFYSYRKNPFSVATLSGEESIFVWARNPRKFSQKASKRQVCKDPKMVYIVCLAMLQLQKKMQFLVKLHSLFQAPCPAT